MSLPLFCTTTMWNFQKLRSYTFFRRKSRQCSRSVFFFTAAHFHLALVAASISDFMTAATKFSCCSSDKNMSPLFFLSLALDLCRPFSRWASLACRLLSLFLCLSLSLYSKFVDMTINLSFTDTETISASRFRIYWLFSCLCFTSRGWLSDFPPK